MSPEHEQQVQELAAMLRESGRTVVLTGAGVSTESGIPDFRTPGSGLWSQVDPMEILSVTAMRRDPKRFYEFKVPLWRALEAAEPNPGHVALARLQKLGLVRTLVTQNIDSLHFRAGSYPVLEIHGHMRTGRCLDCDEHVPFEELADRFEAGQCPPRCQCGGVLRPDVVLFEDMLPEAFETSCYEASRADLLLVVGSSLEVAPANTIPMYARKVAILNVGSTQWDREAAWVCRAKAGEFLPRVVSLLEGTRS
jgi:NAD-dependent deacetylase